MVIGILTIELDLPGINSLKEKRRVLKSLIGRLKSRFNISAAEIGDNDKYRKAVLGVSVVSNQKAHADSVLNHVLDFVEAHGFVEIVHMELELL